MSDGLRARHEREVYPHIEERIGEDPARWLDRELDGPGPLRYIESRIAGIDRLAVIKAWRDVEDHLLRTPEEGRPAVTERLDRRARELEEHGEREDHLEGVDERRAARRAELDEGDDQEEVRELWRHVACGSLDVERESHIAWLCRTCEQRAPRNRVEAVDVDDVSPDELPAALEQDGADD